MNERGEMSGCLTAFFCFMIVVAFLCWFGATTGPKQEACRARGGVPVIDVTYQVRCVERVKK